MRQSAAVDELEFAAERHSMCKPRCPDASLACDLPEQMRGRFAFDGRVRGDDQLAHFTFGEPRGEQIQPEFLRSETVERRKPPEQYEISPAESRGLFDRDLIGRSFDDTQCLRVARRTGADRTDRRVAERAAAVAVADAVKEVFPFVKFTTVSAGGCGAIREVTDLILKAKQIST